MIDPKCISGDGLPSSEMYSLSPSPQKIPPGLSSFLSTPSSPPSTRTSSPNQNTPSSSAEEALASLSIEDYEDAHMFRSLAVIFRNAQEQEGTLRLSSIGAEVVWTSLQRADVSARHGIQDTAALRATRDVLEQMSWNQSHLLADASKVLADMSRDGRLCSVVPEVVGRLENY